MNQIELHTERLILKSITPAIIHELFETKSKQEIINYFGFNESGYEHYKAIHEKGVETHRLSIFVFLLTDKETNIPIGECGFHTWNATHKRAEIFYNMFNENFKQKGLMKEALQKILDYGFNSLQLHRVQALIDDNNQPSYKLLKHYGFVKEGIMREDYCVNGKNEDSTCYSLLKWEWENQK